MKRSKPVFFMERPAAQMAQKTGPPGAPWLTVSPPTHAQTRPSICQPAGPPGGVRGDVWGLEQGVTVGQKLPNPSSGENWVTQERLAGQHLIPLGPPVLFIS